jgi:UDP-N-acetylmuramate dehydrogenase
MHLEENKSLKHLNTFGIDVNAKYYAEINSVENFKELVADKKLHVEKKLILGGGSNILFTKNFDGIVIKNRLPGLTVVSETENQVVVKAAAGELWHQFVLYTIQQNYAGIENLSLIPGCVGAAPMQNIGAYGVEIKDVFHELEALNIQTGELRTFNINDCQFGYRESIFKHEYRAQFLICFLSLKLTKLNAPNALYRFKTDYGDIKATLSDMRAYDLTLKTVSDAIIKIRSSKLPDPKTMGNAGSFFKNPSIEKDLFEKLIAQNPLMPNYPQKDGTVKIPAGWLIEQCGWKGKVVGNTGAHKSQALVLVNYGNASGEEIWQLAMNIQESVKEKFGILISPEVNVI